MYCVVLQTSTWHKTNWANFFRRQDRPSNKQNNVMQPSSTRTASAPREGIRDRSPHRYQTNSLTRKHINLASNDDSISSLFSGAILHNNTINININPQFAESKQHQPRRNNKFIIYDSDDDE